MSLRQKKLKEKNGSGIKMCNRVQKLKFNKVNISYLRLK